MKKFMPLFPKRFGGAARRLRDVGRMLWGGDAGKRAFFAFTLCVFGMWSLYALFTLLGGWDSIHRQWLGFSWVPGGRFSWAAANLVLPFLLPLYAAVAVARLWYTVLKGSHRFSIGLFAAGVPALSAVIASGADALPSVEYWGLAVAVAVLVYFPLLVYPRQWILVLLRGTVWGLALSAMWRGVWNFLSLQAHTTHYRMILHCKPLEFPWPDEPLAALSLPLWLLGCWLTAKIVAAATGQPWKGLFGRGTCAVLGIFAAVYALSLGAAFAEHCRTERSIAELAEFHGASATPQTFRDRYYAGRRADAGFWKRVVSLNGNRPYVAGEVRVTEADPAAGFAPEVLKQLRRQLASSKELKQLEEMFSAPPPPDLRDYDDCDLFELSQPGLKAIRVFCRCEAWRIRFAVADGDAATALAALRRLENLYEYLGRDDLFIAQIVRAAVDELRLGALERVLDARMLPEAELCRQRRLLESDQRDDRFRHRRFAFAEATAVLQFCDGVGRGGMKFVACDSSIPGGKVVVGPLYPYRWLFPPFWYLFTCNRGEAARTYAVADLMRIDPGSKPDGKRLLVQLLQPELPKIGARFDALSVRRKKLLQRLDAAAPSPHGQP